jgi:hypothetical protein
VTRRASRADRIRDLAATAIVVAGAVVWGYGFVGLRRQAAHPASGAGRTAVAQTTFYWNIARAGAALVVAGVAVVAWSYWRYHAHRDTRS